MSDYNEVFEKYFDTKNKIQDLNEKLEKYKKAIEKILDKDDTSKIRTEKFVVQRKTTKSERINKSDIPSDVWEKYKKTSKYNSLIIQKL